MATVQVLNIASVHQESFLVIATSRCAQDSEKLVANCQSLVALAECLRHLRANHGGSSVAKGGRRIPSVQLASISLLDPVVMKFLKMS